MSTVSLLSYSRNRMFAYHSVSDLTIRVVHSRSEVMVLLRPNWHSSRRLHDLWPRESHNLITSTHPTQYCRPPPMTGPTAWSGAVTPSLTSQQEEEEEQSPSGPQVCPPWSTGTSRLRNLQAGGLLVAASWGSVKSRSSGSSGKLWKNSKCAILSVFKIKNI